MLFKTIFNVNLLHWYFLDEGESKFSGMSDKKKGKALKNYRFSNFLKIAPTDATQNLLKNHRILFRPQMQQILIIQTIFMDSIMMH